MLNLRETLLAVADAYAGQRQLRGGASLARISTIVLNQGGFFQRLRVGKTCTLDSFEALLRWFAVAENWPNCTIPDDIARLMQPFRGGSVISTEAE